MKVTNIDMHGPACKQEELVESADLIRLKREKEETLKRLEQLDRMIRDHNENESSEQTLTFTPLQKEAGLLTPEQLQAIHKIKKKKNWETGRIFYQRRKCSLTTNGVKVAKPAENADRSLENENLLEIKVDQMLRSSGGNVESCRNDVSLVNDAQAGETHKAMTQQVPGSSGHSPPKDVAIGTDEELSSSEPVAPMTPSASTFLSPFSRQQDNHERRIVEIILCAILDETKRSNEQARKWNEKSKEEAEKWNEKLNDEAKKQTEKLDKIIELLQLRRFNNSDQEVLIGVQNLVSLETVINDPKWDEWARRGPAKLDEYMRTLALELASRVFFGDDVLIKSNALSMKGGKRQVLDRQVVHKMKMAVKAKTAPDMPDEAFDEKWRRIMYCSMQNRCRNLRNQSARLVTSSELTEQID